MAASVAVAEPATTTEVVSPPADPEALAALAEAQRLVRCGATPLGRGLVALQALDRQCIVSVPLQNALVISDEPLSGISVFGDRCQELWQETHGRLPLQLAEFITGDARWDVRMTAWLLWVASELPDSPLWAAYIATLPPADEVTCLINYGPEVAKELQLKELIEEAKSQYNWAMGVHRKYFDSVQGELAQLKLAASARDTLWAMSMVRTRTFSENVNGEGLTLMVPYADLANHSFRPNATFCMARDNKRFELRLLTSLAPGDEAAISYGESKPNPEVMRDYGFVVPGNPNDRIKLPDQDQLPALYGASVMESVGFKGDWREGTVAPKRTVLESSDGNPAERVKLNRRRCVLLSMGFTDGFPPVKESPGGLFGSWPPKSWTDSGRPPPQHVPAQPRAFEQERTNVAAVRRSYQAALDELPTPLQTDLQLLALHDSGELRLDGLVAGAVRCRTEHKLLLSEAVAILDEYDAWLAKHQEKVTARGRQ
ncbi:hypothetical protein HYH02_003728 [Chlamydomonas schloesseri]|uniref:SET domain-containing protein n=1 Tax=Chlamydomonas schloesseri TaxID=2026947 RepID=A0A835WR82_9CHLO|nr:hypothetical protein HYH02_003728 [Chlamydomonas schloesseri]|eukprot:KAG2451954.1 hypothetical protein HYH02_003728 [Chlamydomonas schloesseri]